MKKISIEYAHIYINQSFNSEQKESIAILKKKEKHYNQLGIKTSRVIMIDDYSMGQNPEKFNLEDYLDRIKEDSAEADVVILESSLIPYCDMVIELLDGNKTSRELKKYIQEKNQYPCSLFISAWYLLRLGKLGIPQITTVRGNCEELLADELVTIVPDYFRGAEDKADKILEETKFGKLNLNILKIFFETKNSFSKWSEFDPSEYVKRNYGGTILEEDSKIIFAATNRLFKLMGDNKFDKVLNIGCGPNLYPSMIVAPYLDDDGKIFMADYSYKNLSYLRRLKEYNGQEIKMWEKFENLLVSVDDSIYRNCIQKTIKNMVIQKGDIFNLSKNEYDCGVAFFVTESIGSNIDIFNKATKCLIDSIKKDGIIITAHVLGSRDYYAGMNTKFPSTKITTKDLDSIYKHYLKNYEILPISHSGEGATPRSGYNGMALVIGIKN